MKKNIEKLAKEFRIAIEKAIDNGERGFFFDTFPKGQCGNACDLLAHYFLSNGVKYIQYVCGTFRNDNMYDTQSHVWLIINENILVDITGDQFKYYDMPLKNETPVHVGEMTDYYKQFDVMSCDIHTHTGLQPEWFNYRDLLAWYKTILKYL